MWGGVILISLLVRLAKEIAEPRREKQNQKNQIKPKQKKTKIKPR